LKEESMHSQTIVGNRKLGLFRELHGIGIAMEPPDLEIYRSLLPPPLSLPERPIISAWVASWDEVEGLRPYREGAIRLRCAYESKEGWFITTMPVTSLRANISGRMLAFPKYTADQIVLNTSPGCPMGEVKHRGLCQLRIQLSPGSPRKLSPAEQKVLDEGQSVWDAPYYLFGTPSRLSNWLFRLWRGLRDERRVLVRPGDRSLLLRITSIDAVPSTWETSERGIAHASVNPAAPWARLFSEEREVPGGMFRWKGGVALVVEELP
jgi:hypothetical protein